MMLWFVLQIADHLRSLGAILGDEKAFDGLPIIIISIEICILIHKPTMIGAELLVAERQRLRCQAQFERIEGPRDEFGSVSYDAFATFLRDEFGLDVQLHSVLAEELDHCACLFAFFLSLCATVVCNNDDIVVDITSRELAEARSAQLEHALVPHATGGSDDNDISKVFYIDNVLLLLLISLAKHIARRCSIAKSGHRCVVAATTSLNAGSRAIRSRRFVQSNCFTSTF
jgi:hypothetical protein